MIKLWQSYACNNSSAYRIVARFADAATARETTDELEAHFAAHAKNWGWQNSPLTVLARSYGSDWTDGSMGKPGVVVEDEVMVVYHSMCLGMGPGIPAYVTDRSGTPERETSSDIQVTSMFRIDPSIDPQRYDELIVIFASQVDHEKAVLLLKPPWASAKAVGNAVWFRDPGTIGLHFPIKPVDIDGFKRWLAGFGIDDAVFRIEDRSDRELFEKLAAVRCTACNGKLEYLDPRLHDIETPQLMCRPCGGLYDLTAFP